MKNSSIKFAHGTFWGCTKVPAGPGCDNCDDHSAPPVLDAHGRKLAEIEKACLCDGDSTDTMGPASGRRSSFWEALQ